MSLEQAKAFMEKVKNDEDLAERLSEAQKIESKLQIAREVGYEFNEEEIKRAIEEHSEDELQNVVGGRVSTDGCFFQWTESIPNFLG
jgi:predicted ribosomally synthesized peptide with nif11-like leader